MSKPQARVKQTEDAPSEEFSRFDNLMRALFRVDRNDVEKHEPVKRSVPATPGK